MLQELCFSKIENDSIFVTDYSDVQKNNKITFSKEGIAVLYPCASSFSKWVPYTV